MAKISLVVFDFDETIVNCNADTFVNSFCPDGKVPPEKRFDGTSWTKYMGALFEYFHSIGVRESDYIKLMVQMPFVTGLQDLILNLVKPTNEAENQFEVIIISDANDYFINLFLKHHGLNLKEVFSNRAHFNESGCLILEGYHVQSYCKNSPQNLCKGQVLLDYIKKRKSEGVNFSQMIYCGDGSNDLCPSSKLLSTDLVFARRGFGLEKAIASGRGPGGPLAVNANVHYWDSGFDILQALKMDPFRKPFNNLSKELMSKKSVPPTPPPSPADGYPASQVPNGAIFKGI